MAAPSHMRILMLGGFQEKSVMGRFYDVGLKSHNGFIRQGHQVLHFSDKDTARHATPFGSRKVGHGKANKQFLQWAKDYQPHLIVLVHAHVVKVETLKKIRNVLPATPIIQINVDPLFEEDNVQRIRERGEGVDWTFITTAGPEITRLKVAKERIAHIPNPFDKAIESGQTFAKSDLPWDMTFLYGGCPKSDPRYYVPRNLQKALPKLRLSLHCHDKGNLVYGVAYPELLRSARMGLNLSRQGLGDVYGKPDEMYLYSSDRISHIIGNGVLAISHKVHKLQEYWTDTEMVFFEEEAELHDKIRHLLLNDDQAKKMAQAGWEKGHREHAAEVICQFMIEKAFDAPLSRDYFWPTEEY